jgi:hypothetical protein
MKKYIFPIAVDRPTEKTVICSCVCNLGTCPYSNGPFSESCVGGCCLSGAPSRRLRGGCASWFVPPGTRVVSFRVLLLRLWVHSWCPNRARVCPCGSLLWNTCWWLCSGLRCDCGCVWFDGRELLLTVVTGLCLVSHTWLKIIGKRGGPTVIYLLQ